MNTKEYNFYEALSDQVSVNKVNIIPYNVSKNPRNMNE